MASVSFSIAGLFEDIFGYSSPAFGNELELNGAAIPDDEAKGLMMTKSAASPYWATDVFGREFYMPVTLGGVQLPYPVISIRASKRIIDTPLVEREGEVEELISISSYQVVIKGVMAAKDRRFPEDQVRSIVDLFKRNEALDIINPISELHLPTSSDGRRKVTMRDYDFPEGRSMGARGYVFSLKSSLDFNLFEIS